jgi:hypothetical protein
MGTWNFAYILFTLFLVYLSRFPGVSTDSGKTIVTLRSQQNGLRCVATTYRPTIASMVAMSEIFQRLVCATRARNSRFIQATIMAVSSDLRPLLTDMSILLVFDSHHLESRVGSRGQCLCSHVLFAVTSRIERRTLSYVEASAYFSKICMVVFWKSCSSFCVANCLR